jgi:hypothetical protein
VRKKAHVALRLETTLTFGVNCLLIHVTFSRGSAPCLPRSRLIIHHVSLILRLALRDEKLPVRLVSTIFAVNRRG